MNTTVTVSNATKMGNHNPHGAGITTHLKNAGTLDRIATMENTDSATLRPSDGRCFVSKVELVQI